MTPDPIFELRKRLVLLLAERAIGLEDVIKMLAEVSERAGIDLELLKLSIADLIQVRDRKVKLSRDGRVLLDILLRYCSC